MIGYSRRTMPDLTTNQRTYIAIDKISAAWILLSDARMQLLDVNQIEFDRLVRISDRLDKIQDRLRKSVGVRQSR